MLIMFYVFNLDEVRFMVKVGVDIVVVYMGLMMGGFIGVQEVEGGNNKVLGDCVEWVQVIRDVVYVVNFEIIVFCYGGVIVSLEDVGYVLE